jgi:hypothetical protein
MGDLDGDMGRRRRQNHPGGVAIAGEAKEGVDDGTVTYDR